MSPRPRNGPAKPVSLPEAVRPEVGPDEPDDLRQVLRRFNHRCRNSLSGLKLGLYLSQQEVQGPIPRCWTDLSRAYDEVETLV